MKSLPSGFLAETLKDNTHPVRLYQIGGTPNLYYTDADKDVYYNSQVWTAKGITYSKGTVTLGLEVDTYNVSIDNYDSGMIAWAVANNPIGKISKVMKGFFTGSFDGSGRMLLVDNHAVTIFEGRNTAMKVDLEFEMIIKSSLDLFGQVGPKSRQEVTCRFKGQNGFKGPNCGYAGAETTCNYTKARCDALGNTLRFGGFPHLSERVTV